MFVKGTAHSLELFWVQLMSFSLVPMFRTDSVEIKGSDFVLLRCAWFLLNSGSSSALVVNIAAGRPAVFLRRARLCDVSAALENSG